MLRESAFVDGALAGTGGGGTKRWGLRFSIGPWRGREGAKAARGGRGGEGREE